MADRYLIWGKNWAQKAVSGLCRKRPSMSELGQARRFSIPRCMSAKPFIATEKADIAGRAHAPLVRNRGVRPWTRTLSQPLRNAYPGIRAS
jgi:hypothetical protein